MEVPDLCWGGGWVGGSCSAQPNSRRPGQRETAKTGEQQSGSCPRPRKLSVLFHAAPCPQVKTAPVSEKSWVSRYARLSHTVSNKAATYLPGFPWAAQSLSTEAAGSPKWERVGLRLFSLHTFGPLINSPASASSSMDKEKQ